MYPHVRRLGVGKVLRGVCRLPFFLSKKEN
jgi:hypothetical protein